MSDVCLEYDLVAAEDLSLGFELDAVDSTVHHESVVDELHLLPGEELQPGPGYAPQPPLPDDLLDLVELDELGGADGGQAVPGWSDVGVQTHQRSDFLQPGAVKQRLWWNERSSSPEIDVLPGLVPVVRQTIEEFLEEGDDVVVVGKLVSVEEPGIVRDDPGDLVGIHTVVQEVEGGVNPRLASSHYQVLVILLSHGGQA